MLQESNVIYENVHFTDEIKIGLDYDIYRGLLNIFIKNTDYSIESPSHINILSNRYEEHELLLDNNGHFLNSPEIQQDLENEITDMAYREENDLKICIELSNIYVYDLFDENESNLCQTMITSSPLLFASSLSPSLSCFDGSTTENDDGYSTFSLGDIEQQHQQSISVPSLKLIIPFVSHSYPKEQISAVRRLIEQLIWLNPFKEAVKQMMVSHVFD